MDNFEKNKYELELALDEKDGGGFSVCKRIRELRGVNPDCTGVFCSICEQENWKWLLAEYEEPKNDGWHKLEIDPNDLPEYINVNYLVDCEPYGYVFATYEGKGEWTFRGVNYRMGTSPKVIKWKEIDVEEMINE